MSSSTFSRTVFLCNVFGFHRPGGSGSYTFSRSYNYLRRSILLVYSCFSFISISSLFLSLLPLYFVDSAGENPLNLAEMQVDTVRPYCTRLSCLQFLCISKIFENINRSYLPLKNSLKNRRTEGEGDYTVAHLFISSSQN